MNALHDAEGVDPLGLEGRDSLINEVQRRDGERDPLFLVESAADDMRRRQRLSETGRR